MNRWTAAATHLALSVLVIGGIALGAYLLWFPMGLYPLSGLDRLLVLMLTIDLAAGPLLTLVVYRPGKRGLKLDLAIIGICQIALLGYGLHALSQARPVFLLGLPDRFTLVFANDLRADALAAAARPEWRHLSWTGPRLVGTRMPEDRERRNAVMQDLMDGGPGLEFSPRWYLPYREVAADILARSEPVEAVPGDGRAATGPDASLRRHPVYSRFGHGWMLIDATTGAPLRVVEPQPAQ